MLDIISDLMRRVRILENKSDGAKEFSAVVTNVDDPEGKNRVKAQCADIWGTMESGWLVSKTGYNGPGIGDVFTPRVGDRINVQLRDGNRDAGEYEGGSRDGESTVPEEFADPQINGRKTASGIVEKYNDIEGTYSVETEAGSKVVVDGEGNIHIYGGVVYVHGDVELNTDDLQWGVVTCSLAHQCPVFGPHRGSVHVKASE